MNDSENEITKIFQRAVKEILLPGQALELFAPDFVDDLPEAKMMGVEYSATSMYYRAESKISGIWVMFAETDSFLEMPGCPQYSRSQSHQTLELRSEMPEFKPLSMDPNKMPLLQGGILLVGISAYLDERRRIRKVGIRHDGSVDRPLDVALLILKMIELVSHDAQECLQH